MSFKNVADFLLGGKSSSSGSENSEDSDTTLQSANSGTEDNVSTEPAPTTGTLQSQTGASNVESEKSKTGTYDTSKPGSKTFAMLSKSKSSTTPDANTDPVVNQNMTDEELQKVHRFYHKRRQYTRAQFTKNYNYINKILSLTTLSRVDTEELTQQLNSLETKLLTLRSIQEQMSMCVTDDSEMDEMDPQETDFAKISAEVKAKIGPSTRTPKKKKIVDSTPTTDDDGDDGDIDDDDVDTRFQPHQAGKKPNTMSEDDKRFFALLNMNYSPKRDVPEFNGSDQNKFASFRTAWEIADGKMDNMGKSPSERLILLKKCISGKALSMIDSLQDGIDANYVEALNILDRQYGNRKVIAKKVIARMHDIAQMTSDPMSLEDLVMGITKGHHELEGLKLTHKQKSTLYFTTLVESKMNNYMKKSWAKKCAEKKSELNPLGHTADETDLFEIMQRELDLAREMNTKPKKEVKEDDKQKRDGPKQASSSGGGGSWREQRQAGKGSHGASHSDPPKDPLHSKCGFCKKDGHRIGNCKTLKNKTVDERWTYVKENKLCCLCFRSDHKSPDCKYQPCNIDNCNKRHSRFLHPISSGQQNFKGSHATGKQQQTQAKKPKESKETKDSEDGKSAMAAKKKEEPADKHVAILQSCIAWAMGPSGEKFKIRCFLDGGSEVSLITRKTSEMMGLNGKPTTLQLHGVLGAETPPTKEKIVNFRLMSLDEKYKSVLIEATTTKSISKDLREVPVSIEDYDHLRNLKFTEEFPRKSTEVDIMVGLPYYAQLIAGQPIKGKTHEPIAQPTRLGMILTGSFPGAGLTQQ